MKHFVSLLIHVILFFVTLGMFIASVTWGMHLISTPDTVNTIFGVVICVVGTVISTLLMWNALISGKKLFIHHDGEVSK